MNGLSRTDFAGASSRPRSVGKQAELRHFGRDWPAFWRRLGTRRALHELDDQQLRDIGLTRAEAEREANLPFWKL